MAGPCWQPSVGRRIALGQVDILDIHVHVGDHCLASVILWNEGLPIRHFLASVRSFKPSAQAVAWTTKRLGHYVAQKWMKHEFKLKDGSGTVVPPVSETNATLL